MAATTDNFRTRRPLHRTPVGLLAAVWVAILVAQIVSFEFRQKPLEAIALGMRFEGFAAGVAIVAEAIAIATLTIGLSSQKRWGLWFAMAYLFEVIVSRLAFMIAYLDDLSQTRNLRASALLGIGSTLILLSLWIRSREPALRARGFEVRRAAELPKRLALRPADCKSIGR